MKETILSVSLCYDLDNPIFSESSTKISLNDEAAGFFIELTQDCKTLRFNKGELEKITEIANRLLDQEVKE